MCSSYLRSLQILNDTSKDEDSSHGMDEFPFDAQSPSLQGFYHATQAFAAQVNKSVSSMDKKLDAFLSRYPPAKTPAHGREADSSDEHDDDGLFDKTAKRQGAPKQTLPSRKELQVRR